MKAEVAILGSPSLTILMVSVDENNIRINTCAYCRQMCLIGETVILFNSWL